jgi:two-component system cell cycle sensor histidine kinase/response regulator CckA
MNYNTLTKSELINQLKQNGKRIAELKNLCNQEPGSGFIEEKLKYETILSSIGDGVITFDLDGIIIYFNKAAESLTGWSCSEAIDKPAGQILTIMDKETKKIHGDPVQQIYKTGTISNLDQHVILVTKDNSEIIISGCTTPVFNSANEQTGSTLVFRDITIQQRLNDEYYKTKNISSIGVLAGGIAHDFNNYLTTILTSISFLKTVIKPDHDHHDIVVLAEKASLMAKDLTSKLLTFSQGGAPVTSTHSLIQIVKDVINFIIKGYRFKCEYEIQDNLYYVDIDHGQINQVLNNIILNSVQSMNPDGKISISAQNFEYLETSKNLPLENGKYVKLTIVDQGRGLPDGDVQKIFDPYFSISDDGTGLGMAIAYSIIKKHKGLIELTSKIDKGTTVTIYLPASKVLHVPKGKAETGSDAVKLHKGKILLMDDDALILSVGKKLMTIIGYDITTAYDGEEAIMYYRNAMKHHKPFDVVILDLVIPNGSGGEETMMKLKEIDPYVKGIVSSGYSHNPIMSNYARYGFIEILKKPYTITQLIQKLSVVMNKE